MKPCIQCGIVMTTNPEGLCESCGIGREIIQDSLQPERDRIEKLESLMDEWCDKIDKALDKNQTFDTFTQHYYDLFCGALNRENNRH